MQFTAARVPIDRDDDRIAARERRRHPALRISVCGHDRSFVAAATFEMAPNVVLRAQRGKGALSAEDDTPILTMMARHAGPDRVDGARAMRDGFSTGHCLGLGSIARDMGLQP